MQRHEYNGAARSISRPYGLMNNDGYQSFHSLLQLVRALEHVHHYPGRSSQHITYHVIGGAVHASPDRRITSFQRRLADFRNGIHPLVTFQGRLKQGLVRFPDIGVAELADIPYRYPDKDCHRT